MTPELWWGVNALWLTVSLWAARVAYLAGKRDGFNRALWLHGLGRTSHD